MKIILRRAEVTTHAYPYGMLWMYQSGRDVRYFYTWPWIVKWVLHETTK